MPKASKVNQLEKLDRLYEEGRLSKSEYKKMRAEIITGREHIYQKTGCLGLLFKLLFACVGATIILAFLIRNDTPKTSQPEKIETQAQADTNIETTLDELAKQNGTGCYTSPQTVQTVRDEINAYGQSKGWNSESQIAEQLGYVHFAKLLEDAVMMKSINMPVSQFLQKREEYPNINKEERKQKAQCDFIANSIPAESVAEPPTTNEVNKIEGERELKPINTQEDSKLNNLF